MTATLADWLERLGVEHPKGVLDGLDRVAEVAARANVNPPAPRNFIVAGTNGKGTTCLFLERLLLAAGHATGTTLSPHLTRFNERIRVNGSEADDATIVAAFEAVERARDATRLNYFEYAVLAALATFRAAPMDAAVLEVGLGGRLDATNVVDAEVAMIVSIGLDHQRYLGDTREAIGAEKAGVMRPGRPVVFGAPNPPASVRQRAAELDAPFFQYGRDFRQSTQDGAWRVELADGRVVSTPTPPRVPAANAATALQAFALLEPDFDDTVVEAACRLAFAPGRLETVHARGRRWLLDVGHNADAAAFLACHLPVRTACAIVAMLEDKDCEAVAAALAPRVKRFIATDNHMARGLSAAALAERMGALAPRPLADLDAAIATAIAKTERNDVILVCGSFDVVARVRARLNC